MARVERITELHDHAEDEDYEVSVAARVVNYVFGVIIAFIIVRMILMLLAANHGNAFVDFVYGVSGIFVAPFYGIFNYTPVYGSSVFDVSALVAIVVYALLGWGISSLFTLSRHHHATV